MTMMPGMGPGNFIFGGNTGISYEDLQRRKAARMNQRSAGPMPIRNAGDGWNSALRSILGGLEDRRLRQAEAAGRAQSQSALQNVFGGNIPPPPVQEPPQQVSQVDPATGSTVNSLPTPPPIQSQPMGPESQPIPEPAPAGVEPAVQDMWSLLDNADPQDLWKLVQDPYVDDVTKKLLMTYAQNKLAQRGQMMGEGGAEAKPTVTRMVHAPGGGTMQVEVDPKEIKNGRAPGPDGRMMRIVGAAGRHASIYRDGKLIQTDLETGDVKVSTVTDQIQKAEDMAIAEGLAKNTVDRITGLQAMIPKMVDNTNIMLTTLDDPELVGSVGGLEGIVTEFFPAWLKSESKSSFQRKFKQVYNQAFLTAFDSLRGGGQITVIEGQKAQDAFSRLTAITDEKDFKIALADLASVYHNMLNAKAQGVPDQHLPAGFDDSLAAIRDIAKDYNPRYGVSSAGYLIFDGEKRGKELNDQSAKQLFQLDSNEIEPPAPTESSGLFGSALGAGLLRNGRTQPRPPSALFGGYG